MGHRPSPGSQLVMHFRITTYLFVTLAFISSTANSQHLFGNPSCANWQKLPHTEKTTWLNAFLVPLNLTNLSRKKLVLKSISNPNDFGIENRFLVFKFFKNNIKEYLTDENFFTLIKNLNSKNYKLIIHLLNYFKKK